MNIEKYIGAILVDENNYKWKILGYQGDKLRVYNLSYDFLSEAEGENLEELMYELESIEEIFLKEIILKER
jgi:hypothetical protein